MAIPGPCTFFLDLRVGNSPGPCTESRQGPIAGAHDGNHVKRGKVFGGGLRNFAPGPAEGVHIQTSENATSFLVAVKEFNLSYHILDV